MEGRKTLDKSAKKTVGVKMRADSHGQWWCRKTEKNYLNKK